MIDTLIYVMIVLIDTTYVPGNRFKKDFEEADRQFNIEMMRQASHEAAMEAAQKSNKNTHHVKVLKIYRKEDE